MKTWLANRWDDVRTGFWFVPSLIIIAAVVLAFVAPLADRWLGGVPEWFQFTASAATALLTTLAGAMITVAGVVFSVTVVTLSITSSQFGPRLLRTFLSEPVSQAALGVCLGSGLFCLLLLRKLGTDPTVPHLSIALGVVLCVAAVGVLVYFIHRVTRVVQADHVVADVARDLDNAIARLFPEEIGEGGLAAGADAGDAELADEQADWAAVHAEQDGYLQAVNHEELMALVAEHDLVVRVDCRPGDFIVAEMPLARAHPRQRLADDVEDELKGCFLVGDGRTPRQDVECAVDDLVEVALRALSPGINDPFTAMRCVDRLGATLSRLATRKIPSPYRYDEAGNLRVVARGWTFANVLDAAFNPIRQYGRTSVSVTIRLLEALTTIAGQASRDEDRTAVRRQAEMIRAGAEESLAEPRDVADMCERYEQFLAVLGDRRRPS